MKTHTITQKITARSINEKLPEGATELVVKDSALTGFRLRITKRAKRYVYAGRVVGGPRRTVTIGDALAMTAAEARREAQAVRNKFLAGDDPQPAKPVQKAVTFELAYRTRFDLWVDGKLRDQANRGAPAKETIKSAKSGIIRVLEHMGTLPVRDVDLDVARAFMTELENEDVGSDVKRRSVGEASRVMDFAVARGWTDINPFRIMPNFATAKARTRVLSLDEVRRLWAAAGRMGRYGPMLRLLIAQPLRLSCALTLKWQDIDMDAGVIVLPEDMIGNKAKIRFSLAMTEAARGVLDTVERRAPGDFVFRGRTEVSRLWWDQVRADEYAAMHGVPDFRLHDLRTAFASILGDRFPDADVDAIDLMLAHKRLGVKGRYQQSFRLDAQRRVSTLWDKLLTNNEQKVSQIYA